ncbi:extensin-like [Marmota marmota marmota]|uniref:extensin-like n=1 Tax=Marmota marmota marmota TaxID=9994 RepID=UPI0007626037|nr:extensin-like [Marmota marmota marmota]
MPPPPLLLPSARRVRPSLRPQPARELHTRRALSRLRKASSSGSCTPTGLLPLRLGPCAPKPPGPPSPESFSAPKKPARDCRTRTRTAVPLTFSRRWWRRRTSPAATTDPAPQSQTHRCLRRAPLALLLAAAPPTPTLIGPSPRPSPPPPDPLVRLRAHLLEKTLATRTKLPSRVRLPPPTWTDAHWLPLPAQAPRAPIS